MFIPLTRETCRVFFHDQVKKLDIDEFFRPKQIDQFSDRAFLRLNELQRKAKGHLTKKEIHYFGLGILLISLYKIHILIDNTGSMRDENRIQAAHAAIRGIVKIDTSINHKGVHLHVLNDLDPSSLVKSVVDFEDLWANVQFHGPTILGSILKEKVISNIFPNDMKWPSLVYIITDGKPTQEPQNALEDSIKECKAALVRNNYSASAIAFGIVQVGSDLGARRFLGELRRSKNLQDDLDVGNEDDFLENKYRRSLGLPEEAASLLYAELLAGAIDPDLRLNYF